MTTRTKAILGIILSCIVAIAGIFGIQVYSSCHSVGNWNMMFKKLDKTENVYPPQPVEDVTNIER